MAQKFGKTVSRILRSGPESLQCILVRDVKLIEGVQRLATKMI